MKKKKTPIIALLMIILFTIGMLTLFISCEPLIDIIIENQTSEILTIYFDKEKVGDVKPNGQITIKEKPAPNIFNIVAINKSGKTIFSDNLTPMDMQYIGKEKAKEIYKVVIPLLIQVSESSENFTTDTITAK